MSNECKVVSVNISESKGTVKKPVDSIVIDILGVVGDAHAGPGLRQISLLSLESIQRFNSEVNRDIKPGDFAENITLSGLDFKIISPLDEFIIGDVHLQVTQLGKECRGDGCAIFQNVGKCVMPTEGVFCKVISGGNVKPGDIVQYIPNVLQIKVITLSDRAFRGEYEDLSGPEIAQLLTDFFGKKRFKINIERCLLPDEYNNLVSKLENAKNIGTDIVFTTGGTGVGMRDITPETALSVFDKTIPGIMDSIRLKYGAENPNALLSRSVAGVAGKTLIYTLPGSVKACREYMTEIFKTLQHLIYTIRGLDTH